MSHDDNQQRASSDEPQQGAASSDQDSSGQNSSGQNSSGQNSSGQNSSDQELTFRNVWARHPIMVSVFVGSGVLGAVLGVYLLPDEWSLLRKISGGALAGAFHGLLIIFSRMAGAWRAGP